ncbi:hypothetical protein DB313_05870 (plasmid) [Borrelia turcica IST7]|uniref:Lipoprotein n=1 Tax=Borrelia turcica IST7 TaxID=1104446 RepID=A0A386PPZ7_9SPIR|nr:hypothetical protein [Borrelia turcica]AYE37025.1 hypothetical protein DB313_05870 [Borrelia turcica IST7]
MRVLSNFIYIFVIFLFFLSCSTVLLDEPRKEDDPDLLALRNLMVYPELKISNFDMKIYEKLKNYHEHNFEILEREDEDPVYISESSYKENIDYIKELYFYNKKLYKVVLAYSSVQGSPFKSEMLKYLKKHNIKEKFPLRIRFPTYKTCIDGSNWIVLKKDFFDMIMQDKNALLVSNRIMENIVRRFSE